MLSHEKNEILCRVGADRPMGQLMRRYWLPATLSGELDAGGAVKRVKLLGEELVVWRAPDGSVGLMDEYCPHRRASMAIARNEACGLRCIYHGWKIAADGRVVETPPEPDYSSRKDRIRIAAYPVREAGGIVWCYMGPAEVAPPPMDFEFAGLPQSHVLIMKAREECNWAQCVEGVIDSAHSNYLHSAGIVPNSGLATTEEGNAAAQFERPSNDGAPRLEVEDMPYGFRYAAIRRPIVAPERNKYVRVTLFVAPIYAIFPAAKGWGSMQAFMPLDDGSSMFHYILWKYDSPIDQATRERYLLRHGMRPGVDLDDTFRKVRTRANNWLQDREAMRRGESYSGIHGINTEDFAVQESMGPIVDRSKEHLGASDRAVANFRRLMVESAERLAQGDGPPPGLDGRTDFSRLRSAEAMLSLEARWQMAADGVVAAA